MDGEELSAGSQSFPLDFALNAAENECQAAKIAVRCDVGYHVDGACDIFFKGDTANKWAVAHDEGFSNSIDMLSFGNWDESISIDEVSSVNSIFWVRASSSADESPHNDISVTLHAAAVVVQDDE